MFYAIIRVSCNIRKFIESIDNRLYIGQFSSCKVYDHFPVKRCNKCQKFGHFHANCNANHTCVHCAGEHPSDQCNAKAASDFIPTVQIVNHHMIVPLTLTLTTVLMTVVAIAMLMPKSDYALI